MKLSAIDLAAAKAMGMMPGAFLEAKKRELREQQEREAAEATLTEVDRQAAKALGTTRVAFAASKRRSLQADADRAAAEVELTDVERAAAKAMGMTPAAFLAAKRRSLQTEADRAALQLPPAPAAQRPQMLSVPPTGTTAGTKAMRFAMKREATVLEVDIYDQIGAGFFSEGITAQAVRNTLKQHGDATLIKLRINSEGGDVIDGMAIHNLLKEHPARVEAQIDGLAASIASVIAMAADDIAIAPNAFMMIHDPWGAMRGSADDARQLAELLDKMRDQACAIYCARTGLKRDAVLELMSKETWLTGTEAVDRRFADRLTGGGGAA